MIDGRSNAQTINLLTGEGCTVLSMLPETLLGKFGKFHYLFCTYVHVHFNVIGLRLESIAQGVTCCEVVPALLFSIVPGASRLAAKSAPNACIALCTPVCLRHARPCMQ